MQQQKKPFYDTFMPNNFRLIENQMEEVCKFRKLNEISRHQSNIGDIAPEYMKGNRHNAYFTSLDESGVLKALDVTKNNPSMKLDPSVVALMESILTDEVDRELKAYLGSNYAVMSCGFRTLDSTSRDENPSIKWHCDAAPKNSAMVICYLDSDEDHGSSTLFLPYETTEALKEVGYIYSKTTDRHEHIEDMTDYYGLDGTVERHAFKAGETAVFGAAMVAHRAEVPRDGCTRNTIDIAVIPSPIPWKEALNKGFLPGNAYAGYQGQVERLLACANIVTEELSDEVIQIPMGGNIIDKESLKFHIDSIFTDKAFADRLYQQLLQRDINYKTLTINELLKFIKVQFRDGLDWDKHFNLGDLTNFSDLVDYEKKFTNSIMSFSPSHKPARAEIMWPIPDHAKYPKCKFDMLPFVNDHKIMNKKTPIGSAGSCFAVEIAEVLQEEKFNYVVTELGDNPNEEAIIDGYIPGSGKAMYSANFGILFNTPSLRQIAEKAFGEREFTKYLVQADNGLYMDPYRENVFFASRKNFLRDYPKHIQAIKDVLLESEVFIFTAGLNECWQLFDGTVISRNPRNGFYHLIEHRVLTVEENINNIMTFFNIVKRHNPKFKLILTLSPVPLLATGRGNTHHILEANTHSKAVLRVALEEVVKQHEDIYYLPSYELVTECMPDPWKPDHRHVTRETVEKVVGMFKNMFVEGM